MLRSARKFAAAIPVCVLLAGMAAPAHAGTIIKVQLGGDPTADVHYQNGVFSTIADPDGATTGDQDTNVEYLDFLSGLSDVPPSIASFSITGLTAVPPAQVIPLGGGVNLLVQEFINGTFSLYDFAPGNALLLSGTLSSSTLTGPIGPPATGALFTTSITSVTGGSLAPLLKKDSLSISINLTDINGGAGLGVGIGAAPFLANFEADASVNIAAEPTPEPSTVCMAAICGAIAVGWARRRRIR
jgi:PEP-CTERM motif-containing protein